MTEDSRTRLDVSPLKGLNDAGATRVAMRTGSTINFLFGDHLSSTSVTTDNVGGNPIYQWYYPWGGQRWSSGTNPTSFQFTGQRFENGLNLYYYGARWYDPAAGRFIQSDSLIPDAGNSQAFDRYAYVYNNPLKYVDPSGYKACAEFDEYGNCLTEDQVVWPQPNSSDPNIPNPQYYCDYDLNPSCINPNYDPITQLALTIYGEGGGLSSQAAVNITQTMMNRAYNYWTCWDETCPHRFLNPNHIPWLQISTEQLTALLLYIASEPYTGSDGVDYPAYNAWGAPISKPKTESDLETYNAITGMLSNILYSPGMKPSASPVNMTVYGSYYQSRPEIRYSLAVMYFVSYDYGPIMVAPPGTVWSVNLPEIGNISMVQYYMTLPP